jgi:hypothetical protein
MHIDQNDRRWYFIMTIVTREVRQRNVPMSKTMDEYEGL